MYDSYIIIKHYERRQSTKKATVARKINGSEKIETVCTTRLRFRRIRANSTKACNYAANHIQNVFNERTNLEKYFFQTSSYLVVLAITQRKVP